MNSELNSVLAEARVWLKGQPDVAEGSAHWYALNNFRKFLADIDLDSSAEGLARACHVLTHHITDQFDWSVRYSNEIIFYCERVRTIGKGMRAPSTFERWPPPKKREKLEITAIFSDAEADRMRQGFKPRDMDDRWFAYYEDGWLNFNRSWTGAHIYALRLDGCPSGVRIVDGWVSRDEDYNSPGIEHDRAFVVSLAKQLFGDKAEGG